MNILVTGGGGYVGTRLVEYLTQRDHEVTVVDKFIFGNFIRADCHVIEADILDFDPEWLDGIDSVIHLAGISNDPMAAFKPNQNFTTNTAGTALLVFLCKQRGVRRFVFASTCSIYGYSTSKDMDEDDQVAPSFPYGISKLLAEKAILMGEDDTFRPIILRKATVYGLAPRMRYDLVVNTMTKFGVTRNFIIVNNPDLWRPLVHLEDVCEAYLKAVEAPLGVTGVMNIVHRNYTIMEIARQVKETLSSNGHDVEVKIKHQHDVRNYRASNGKAAELLGAMPRVGIKVGVQEILDHAKSVEDYDWDSSLYVNDLTYRKRVERDQATYGLWKELMRKYEEMMVPEDIVRRYEDFALKDWPQEGP